MTRWTIQHWTWLAPLLAWIVLAASIGTTIPTPLLGAALVAAVLAAVHHAELIAHRIGEPLGTFVLAAAVTVIELGLIVSIMAMSGDGAATLARDTVFAAVMIILNGLVGTCILVGALRHKEQIFQQTGVSASLGTLCALTVLTLVLPNFTVSEPGPVYSYSQLGFVAVVSFMLYGTFVAVQSRACISMTSLQSPEPVLGALETSWGLIPCRTERLPPSFSHSTSAVPCTRAATGSGRAAAATRVRKGALGSVSGWMVTTCLRMQTGARASLNLSGPDAMWSDLLNMGSATPIYE